MTPVTAPETPRQKAERLWEAYGYAYAAEAVAGALAEAAFSDAAAAYAAVADADSEAAYQRGVALWKKEHP
jgi:hypothetical protein